MKKLERTSAAFDLATWPLRWFAQKRSEEAKEVNVPMTDDDLDEKDVQLPGFMVTFGVLFLACWFSIFLVFFFF